MGKHWSFLPHDSQRIAQLERAAGVSPIVAQLLCARGLTDPAAIRSFLEAKLTGLRDPEELPGLPAAADALIAAVREKRRIIVYGDYDADGMTATAILLRCLQMLSANCSYYVPNRLEDGYGLSAEALTTLARQGAEVVVTVDCGIASVAEAEVAVEAGLELIITDHHQLGESLPRAKAVVHPRLPGANYPFGELCGAGVAFKLAWALCQRAEQAKRVSERLRNFLLGAVGLAAIGTVADMVPLVDENRILVRHGLASLAGKPPLGLARLMEATGLDKQPVLTADDIGFTIGPRLNAAGRLGQAQLGVELLTTDSAERAVALADYLDELNNSRSSLERSVYLAANKAIKEEFDAAEDAALVLAERGWHQGVVGIVAGRLAEKYNRPVVLLSLDPLGVKPASGSARSAAGIDLHQALIACTEHLLSHGGHKAAAGLSIEEANIEAFRAAFCEHIAGELAGPAPPAELFIDAEAPLSMLTQRTVEDIEQLAPFGQGNPRPLLCASGVRLLEEPKKMGGGERHLSLKLNHHGVSLRAVAFGRGEWAEPLAEIDGEIDIAYRPVINQWRGRRSVELHLEDWRPAEAAAPVGSEK